VGKGKYEKVGGKKLTSEGLIADPIKTKKVEASDFAERGEKKNCLMLREDGI